MPTVLCKVCSKKFYGKPYFLSIGQAKYCSTKCQYSDRRLGRNVPCNVCGKLTYKQPKQLKGSKSGKFFCGKSCQAIWRNQEFVGQRHQNWKNGLFAYRSVLNRNKVPKICSLCGTLDQRVLAVHHIDKNRKNNKLSNLSWLCHNCHFLVHHYSDEALKFKKNLSIYRVRKKVK